MSNKVHEIVTQKILDELAKGVIPWQKPWTVGGKPLNAVSGKRYRGANTLLLGIDSMVKEFTNPGWITYKQAKKLGGGVKKGEKSSLVTFWKMFKTTDPETGEEKEIPLLRYYNVFNLQQCENIDKSKIAEITAETPEVFEHTPIEAAEKIVENMPNRPEIRHGGGLAFYERNIDLVGIPEMHFFKSIEEYYKTLFHELAHSTGHQSRLNSTDFSSGCGMGSQAYARAELAVDIAASFICAELGIDWTPENTAAYVDSWSKRLADDPKCITIAAGKAQKAADFIMGRLQGETQQPTKKKKPEPAVAQAQYSLAL